MKIDLGTLPDWLGGIGSAGALAALAIGMLYDRRQRRADNREREAERRDAEKAQARLIHTAPFDGHDTQVRARVRNDSSGPVFDVRLELLRGPRDAMRPADVQRDVEVPALPPGGEHEVWLTLAGDEVPIAEGEEFWLRVTFTDAAGLQWSRVDHDEPQRVTTP